MIITFQLYIVQMEDNHRRRGDILGVFKRGNVENSWGLLPTLRINRENRVQYIGEPSAKLYDSDGYRSRVLLSTLFSVAAYREIVLQYSQSVLGLSNFSFCQLLGTLKVQEFFKHSAFEKLESKTAPALACFGWLQRGRENILIMLRI